jgi:hypothetical protein
VAGQADESQCVAAIGHWSEGLQAACCRACWAMMARSRKPLPPAVGQLLLLLLMFVCALGLYACRFEDQLVTHAVPGCMAPLNTLLMISVLGRGSCRWHAVVVVKAADIIVTVVSARSCALASGL